MYKLFDKVVFIIQKKNNEFLDYARAEVVEAENKRSIDTQIKNARKCFDKTIELDNNNFKIEIYESGYKSSVLDCLVYHDKFGDEPYLVALSLDMIFNLLKETDFSKGICCENVMFAKTNGTMGVLTKCMNAYKEAKHDMEIRTLVKTGKKTNKYEFGKNYLSLTENFFYLGQAKSYMISSYIGGSLGPNEIVISRNPKVYHCLIRKENFIAYSGESLELKNYFKQLSSCIKYTKNEARRSYGGEHLKRVFYLGWGGFTPLPRKTLGFDEIKLDDDWEDQLIDFEDEVRLSIEEMINEVIENPIENFDFSKDAYQLNYLLDKFFKTTQSVRPELSERTIKNLKKFGFKIIEED